VCEGCGHKYDLADANRLGATPEERFNRAQSFAKEKRVDLASAYSILLEIMPLEMGRAFYEAQDLGSTPEEKLERAEAFAQKHRVDLASAYSIMLGIMPLETGQALYRAQHSPSAEVSSSAPAETSSAVEAEPEESLRYDPGFAKAVSDGVLTAFHAVTRGDRVAFASKIAAKHNLPMSLAFQVADNRLGIRAAKEKQESTRPQKVEPPTAKTSSTALMIGLGAALLLLIPLGLFGLSDSSTAVPVRSAEPPRLTLSESSQILSEQEPSNDVGESLSPGSDGLPPVSHAPVPAAGK
jgi:hypothetical protein